jgi:hypothetical protein
MRAVPLALTLTLLAASASPASAAPKKSQQQCIAAAESGQQLRTSGRLHEARKAFGLCTASACPAVIRRDCGRWVDELDTLIPTISVKLVDAAGAEVAEGRVLMDGEAFPRPADGHAIPIDPGAHRFSWQRDEGSAVEEQFLVREGEHNRVLTLHAPVVTLGPPPPPATEGARSPGPLPWIVGGAGVALAAVGGIFWAVGLNDRSTLSSTCASSHTCAQSDVDASRTKLVVGDVLLGVGLVAVLGGIYLYLRPGADAPATTTTSSR